MSINRPSDANPPRQEPNNRPLDSAPQDSLVERTSSAANRAFSTTQPLNPNLEALELEKIKKELDAWGNTQPKENQPKTEVAKQIILKCYQSKTDTLDLRYLSLTSLPHNALKKLFFLKNLKLSQNKLTAFDPTDFPNLTHLDLSHNQFTEFKPTARTNLTYLNLSHNQLTAFDSTALPNLIHLDLSRNNLTAFDPTDFPNLIHLDLSRNNLTAFDSTELSDLIYLGLSHNQLMLFNPTGLEKLVSLDIDNNPNLTELPMSLGRCPKLTYISTSNTQIPLNLVQTIMDCTKALRANACIKDLPIKLQLWKGFCLVDTDFNFISNFDDLEKAIIYEWLTRLERSADFRKNQRVLAKVVCNILKDLQNKEFKDLAITQMRVNNEACQDRAAMALNELYLCWEICCNMPDQNDKEKLKLLIRAGKTLTLRKAISEQLKGRTDLVESVETYLYYEIRLAEKLNLLTCIQEMSYEGCAKNLNEKDLEKYIEENYLKEAASLPILDKFLKSNPNFQNALKDILVAANQKLEELGQRPEKLQEESSEAFNHRVLEWEAKQGEIMREKDLDVLNLKIKYLEKELKV